MNKNLHWLKDFTKLTVETDEENPISVLIVTSDGVTTKDGYRVRLTPIYSDNKD